MWGSNARACLPLPHTHFARLCVSNASACCHYKPVARGLWDCNASACMPLPHPHVDGLRVNNAGACCHCKYAAHSRLVGVQVSNA